MGNNKAVSAWSLRAFVTLLVVALIGGCSQDPDNPKTNDASPTSSPSARESPPPDAGQFFTWQEMHELGQQKRQIAKTVRAWAYFLELSARFSGYADPRWGDISTRSFWEIQSNGDDTPGGNRGPVTTRLLKIDISGKTALATICVDNRHTEVTIGESKEWKPLKPAIAVGGPKLRRSDRSPTGWIRTGYGRTGIDIKDCKRSFADEKPAVSKTGAPPGFD